jgi:hypothetical protein
VTDPLNNAQQLASAAKASLLFAVSFHFVKERLVYLEKELRSLAAFPVSRRDTVVFTNTTNQAEQESIRQVLRAAGFVEGRDARLAVKADLPHPFDLTWAHKSLICDTFLAPGSTYTHFVYLEDDLHLTFENFAYFLAAREILRPFNNLVPGFLRTEWSSLRECLTNSDNHASNTLEGRSFITSGDYAFVAADNPYWAGFILDQDLAAEYVNSPSFAPKRSRTENPEVVNYGVRERAAMGLTFENPPAPFHYRVVVPVAMASRLAPSFALLAHLPNNYADIPDEPMGKIAMTDLFAGNFDAKKEVVLSSFESTRKRWLRSGYRAGKILGALCIWCKRDAFIFLGKVRRMIFGSRSAKRE